MRCGAVPCGAVQCGAVQRGAVRCAHISWNVGLVDRSRQFSPAVSLALIRLLPLRIIGCLAIVCCNRVFLLQAK